MSEKKKHVNLDNARLKGQYEIMSKIVHDEVCPFCTESLQKYHHEPILMSGNHWIVTTNQWPYEHTDVHFLFISRKHVETITELEDGAFEELGGYAKDLVRTYQLEYGGLAMRFGDPSKTGGTVNHLHAHLLKAKANLPDNIKVKFKFSR